MGIYVGGCASVDRGKVSQQSVDSALNQASGRNAAPKHQLREWRLELDTGGFVQLILSSSGTYLLRHGYFFLDKNISGGKTLLLSEANLGKYVVRGTNLSLSAPIKSSCQMRLGATAVITMDGNGENLVMDEFSSRNFVFDEFKGRRVLPWLKKFMGSLDADSGLPADDEDSDGKFAAKMGCVQMREGGNISFISPEEQKKMMDDKNPAAESGVAH
jgi:hypothetical protein